MKSVLLYNIYLLKSWKSISEELLNNVPQDDIYVHLSFDLRYSYRILLAYLFLLKYKKVRKIFVTPNDAAYGEALGFAKFKSQINFDQYNILTYIHSKGVSKPNNKFGKDWRAYMKYFVMDRFDLTLKAFTKGYGLYGCNLHVLTEEQKANGRKYAYLYSDFWYAGTFVSANLDVIRDAFDKAKVEKEFYAVEGFWGKLCELKLAFCPHNTPYSLYENPYPRELYVNNYTNP